MVWLEILVWGVPEGSLKVAGFSWRARSRWVLTTRAFATLRDQWMEKSFFAISSVKRPNPLVSKVMEKQSVPAIEVSELRVMVH
jgi:tRNA (Thr-GGU) A37 N-methylase